MPHADLEPSEVHLQSESEQTNYIPERYSQVGREAAFGFLATWLQDNASPQSTAPADAILLAVANRYDEMITTLQSLLADLRAVDDDGQLPNSCSDDDDDSDDGFGGGSRDLSPRPMLHFESSSPGFDFAAQAVSTQCPQPFAVPHTTTAAPEAVPTLLSQVELLLDSAFTAKSHVYFVDETARRIAQITAEATMGVCS